LPQGAQIQAVVQIPEVIRYATTRLMRGQLIGGVIGAGLGLALGIVLASRARRRQQAVAAAAASGVGTRAR
jgi:transketolase N-terminal domain/subunit